MSTEPKQNLGFDYQWLFGFCTIFGLFYLLTKPANNSKVLIFRLAVISVGVIGLLVTTLLKQRRVKAE
jgi:hypothetical protein